ncbi:hypothetical protein FACS189426_18540 [Bacteroidia bacterium]|nr:hypothetical protein FACS189426_18540 [Bacteroidia bacterium]GHV71358.1 hypothetical protein FACS189420_6180 [Bacteroidia bacterium]
MCGYVDSLGEIKIPFEYSMAFTNTFADSIAFVVVMKNSKGVIKAIDRNNKKLFTVFNYDNGPDYPEEGLFRIKDDNTGYIGFADMKGKIVIPSQFFFVNPFSNGFAAFNTGGKIEIEGEHTIVTGGKWGYIDKEGKEIFPAIFDKAFSFNEGKAEVRIGKHIFYISHNE